MIHTFILSMTLLWSLPGFADVKYQKLIKKVSIDAYVKVFTEGFHQGMKRYNSNRSNTSKFVKEFKGKDNLYFTSFFAKTGIRELPEWKVKGIGYALNKDGHELFVSPRLAYKSQVLINGRVFTFKSKDLNQVEKDLKVFLKKQVGFSFMSLLIDQAHAMPMLVFFLIGAIIGAGVMLGEGGFTMLNGQTEKLDELLDHLKEEHGQCRRDIRRHGITAGDVVPGDQATFKNMKQIEEHLGIYDAHYATENRELHSLIFKEFTGVKVDSCEHFAELWEKHAGAIGSRDNNIDQVLSSEKYNQGKMKKVNEVCEVVDNFTGCLTRYKKASLTHTGKRLSGKDYNPETGLYDGGEKSIGTRVKQFLGF